MDFGDAIRAMSDGALMQRAGWNGKGMYIYIEDSMRSDQDRRYEPVICMFTAQGTHQPGWLASQADMLAEDWQEVPE